MNIALVIVNYNRADRTVALLRALVGQQEQDFAAIIIDNGSHPVDAGAVASAVHGTTFRYIRNERNLGFAGGVNVGIRDAITHGAEWCVLLNNDVVVSPNFITQLKDTLARATGVVALPIREKAIAYGGILAWHHATLTHCYDLERAKVLATEGTLYGIGAGIAIPTHVLARVGLLDERYFLYFEDAEWSARARTHGISIDPVAGPVITHEVSASTRALGSELLMQYHWRNAIRFNATRGPWYVKITLPFWALFTIVKQLVKCIVLPHTRGISWAIARGVWDGCLGRSGQITHHQ